MAINLFCPKCKSSQSLRSKFCKNCGHEFKNAKKYRVFVKDQSGRTISKTLDSISVAKKLEVKLKTQVLESSLLGIRKAPPIDEVWQKYLAWAKVHKKSWQQDKLRWEYHVQDFLKGRRMDTITGFDIQRVINGMKAKRKYAPATIKHAVVLIKRVYNWAMQMDLYEGSNPASRIKLPKLECLSKGEIKRLLKTLAGWKNQRAALLVKFALYTGLRRGELFSLRWKDVDFGNGWIWLLDTKGGKDNKLPVSDKAMDILIQASQLLPFPESQYVFPNRHGHKRTTIGNTWTRIKKCAKIPHSFRFHGLRHTYASYLASSGTVSIFLPVRQG